MAVFGVQNINTDDEITHYQVGRYVSCNEAIWRIFSFPIHERHPTVVHLAVHLEDGQRVYFNASNVAQRAETPPMTTLTSFFSICQSDPFAQSLLYSEVPSYYTWNASSKKFQRRKQGDGVPGHPDVRSTCSLGRLYTVHPKNDECFSLRLLLVNVRGPTSFQSLRTVNGLVCPTFRAACQKLSLLENDTHWDTTIAEALISASPNQIRTLGVFTIRSGNPELEVNEEIHNQALILIEDICYLMCDSLLVKLGMPTPHRELNEAFNRVLEREHCVTNEDEATNYPTEFLNSLDLPGLPPHNLQLKVGSVIVMIRNLNQPRLCNGTRLLVRKLMDNVIHATILKGKFESEEVLIPRIPMIPTDIPFEFKRIQFPIRLAFAMTINKSQGQSLSVCGLNLENECFSHGQLYVACSRVGKPSALFVFAPDNKTKNVVYNNVIK
ncbi:uncharacterized protein LOC118754555 [Rhagoletis pomonella]|uniref:uncharacterized protein LOC118754555 n=1 Tax=Rhagoletis pomonella TaxID=28610 RepID=UPI0017854BF7|nr:uncharacterized protein LOC118754555 [Rhagoletis pomonella]